MQENSIQSMRKTEILIMKKKADSIDKKYYMLPNHEGLSKLGLNKTQLDFDATSLYHSAMWGQNSAYPKIESGFASKPDMNDVYVEAFNNQTFNQVGDETAILKLK